MMQDDIKAAFEKCLSNELDGYFGGDPDLTLNLDGDYQDAEIYGAFLAFEACWNMRPAMGLFLDINIGQLTQETRRGSPAINFSTQLYRLPPGHYTIHAVQRLAGQSAEDVMQQIQEQTA